MNDNFKVKGTVKFLLTNSLGEVLEERTVPNLVVLAGKTFITSRMAGTSSNVMSHMGVGTSGTATSVGDTALGAEVGRGALSGTTPSGGDILYSATLGPGVGTGALQEAGVFNASSAGTMLCRTTFPVINKAAGDTLQIVWTISVN